MVPFYSLVCPCLALNSSPSQHGAVQCSSMKFSNPHPNIGFHFPQSSTWRSWLNSACINADHLGSINQVFKFKNNKEEHEKAPMIKIFLKKWRQLVSIDFKSKDFQKLFTWQCNVQGFSIVQWLTLVKCYLKSKEQLFLSMSTLYHRDLSFPHFSTLCQ